MEVFRSVMALASEASYLNKTLHILNKTLHISRAGCGWNSTSKPL